MAKFVIEDGNKILMQLVKRAHSMSGNLDVTFYSSQLVQIINQYEMMITVPIFQGHLIPLEIGDIYLTQFYTASGFYQGKCVIVSTSKDNNVALAKIKIITALEKYQRRQYFRMNCLIPVAYAKLTERQQELYAAIKMSKNEERKKQLMETIKNTGLEFRDGTMLDISGGGLRFNSFEKFEKDDVFIVIPDIPKLKNSIPFFMAQIVLVRQIGFDNTQYENKMKFIEITNEEREKVITYIFAEEREKRKVN